MSRGGGTPDDIRARRAWAFLPGSQPPAAAWVGPGSVRPPAIPPSLQVPLPEISPHPSAQYVLRTGQIAAASAVTTPAEIPGAEIQLPAGQVAVIRAFSVAVNSFAATSDITFSLLVDGNPYQGIQYRPFPRNAPSIEVSFEPALIVIRIPEGARISWRATVADGGTYQLGMTWQGWTYPLEVDVRSREAWY